MKKELTKQEQSWYNATLNMLNEHGITIPKLTELVHFLQDKYIGNLTDEMIEKALTGILQKREVQNYIFMALSQDILAEKKLLPKPYQEIVENDEGLFGGDELIAEGICNIFGTISITNFGYIDKIKPGIIGELDAEKYGIGTFADDIAGALAAAAAAKLAHGNAGANSVYEQEI